MEEDNYSGELGEVTYRPFSVMSILAFVFSCIAMVSLLHYSFVPIAFCAAIFALFAVVRTETQSEKPTGASLGYFALFLGTALAAGTLTHKRLEDQRLFSLARQYAEQWLTLVQKGEVYLPFALTAELMYRPDFSVDLKQFYREPKNLKVVTLDAYKVLEPEMSMRLAGSNARCIWEANETRMVRRSRDEMFIMRYRLEWDAPPAMIGELIPGKVIVPAKGDVWSVNVMMRRIDALPPLGPQWIFQSINCIEPKFDRKLPEVDLLD
ncbi:MAG: hypothetical protein KF851_14085 [Pirellulaceae bacterium]|nr:hypothetical protein [Pirellulaceae bacterium]